MSLEPVSPADLPDPAVTRAGLEAALAAGDLNEAVRLTLKAHAIADVAERALGRSQRAREYAVEALRGRWVYAQIAGPNPGSGRRKVSHGNFQDGLTSLQRTRWRALNPLPQPDLERELDRFLDDPEMTDWPAFAPLVEIVRRRARQQVDRDAREIIVEDLDPVSGDGWTLYPGTIADVIPCLPAGSVDMIVTDPPYPAELAHLWSDLAEHAVRLLVPDGILCALTGKIHLLEIQNRLSAAGLDYGWMYAEPLPGSGTRILSRHIIQTWKPWLAFTNGPWPAGRLDWYPDTLDPAPKSKTRHRWEQAAGPAIQLIDRLCPEGGLILDPFCGTGSYGVAALTAGRQFVGVEPDARRFRHAVERLREVAP